MLALRDRSGAHRRFLVVSGTISATSGGAPAKQGVAGAAWRPVWGDRLASRVSWSGVDAPGCLSDRPNRRIRWRLCKDARLVVELDGAHHLESIVAYRRDRRKDQLLQENGYRVLRFLVEDLSKDLDTVLDAILRSLVHRQRL